MQPLLRAICVLAVFLTSCADLPGEAVTEDSRPEQDGTNPDAAALPTLPATTSTPGAAAEGRESVVIPLTLHLVVEAGAPASDLSSERTLEDLLVIANGMREIWAQAGVDLHPINVHQIEMPSEVLRGILLGSTDQFFAQVNTTFVPESSHAVNGFYVRSAFGVNGFTPQGSNLFFVVDDPSVPDERVSSHELGHVLGLHHDLVDPGQLMFSGTSGTGLSDAEQIVARYTAQGLFPQEASP